MTLSRMQHLITPAVLLCSVLTLFPVGPLAAANHPSEQDLLTTLQSGAPEEKALACKQLAVFGSPKAVPALAALLPDSQFASWARIALEAIPGPEADQALIDAMPNLQGALLVGVVNSIGVRRPAQAISPLAHKLKDPDPEVAAAAAVALGRIGGPAAAKPLTRALTKSPPAVRVAVAEGCIRCAETLMDQPNSSQAARLYDTVRHADVPKQKVLEATRGAILARYEQGLPLLLKQIQSSDKAFFAIGLRTARELRGGKITEALAMELRQTSVERQPLLLLAIAERDDDTALPTILDCAKAGSKDLRLMALRILDRLANPASIPVLMSVATDPEPDLAQAAMAVLVRLPGNELESTVPTQLFKATGKNRLVLIRLAGQRQIAAALPNIGADIQDPDPAIRTAAVQTVGVLGGVTEVASLAKCIELTTDTAERAGMETALLAISGRKGSVCVPNLMPLIRSKDNALRIIGFHVLAAAGGPEALAPITAAANNPADAAQDDAVRTLSSWPNTWPEDEGAAEPLLTLAKSSSKPAHQVLAVRGNLQYLQGDKKLDDNAKMARLTDLVPFLKRPEDKQLAIPVIRAISTPAAVELLVNFVGDAAIAEDACAALVDVCAKPASTLSKEDRQKALQTVLDKSQNDSTKERAQKAMKAL